MATKPAMTMSRPAILLIVGPTASGKSDLALDLSLRLGGEIVSSDSMQVYRGLDIGTAKPDAATRRVVPHHLIDVADPGDDFSMGDFTRLAEAAIDEIARRGKLPVVTGGTGLYVRALLRGIFDAPRRDEPLRARLQSIARRRGNAFLHRMLARFDPEAAAKIGVNDPQRVVRAIEVYLLTGTPISLHVRRHGFGAERYPCLKLGLALGREELYRRIDERVGRFVTAGLFDEVRGLLDRGASMESNAFKALGYAEALSVVRGLMSEAEAVEAIARATRQYAKRQLTWFRKEEGVIWLDGSLPRKELADEAERIARDSLDRLRGISR